MRAASRLFVLLRDRPAGVALDGVAPIADGFREAARLSFCPVDRVRLYDLACRTEALQEAGREATKTLEAARCFLNAHALPCHSRLRLAA
jgi:hypothetical protein